MRSLAILILATAATATITACGDSGSATTAPSATQRAAEDLRAAEQKVNAAATEAATEVRPALERAKEETREAVHNLSEKVAERTATAPASPATQP